MSISYRLDWLRWSIPTGQRPDNALPDMDVFAPSDRELSPLPYYNRVAAFNAARVDWNTERPEQKMLITIDGHSLGHYRAAGGDEVDLLKFVQSRPGRTTTRLDFAIDLRNEKSPDAILELLACWQRGEIKTHARTCNRVDGYKRGGRMHGITLYIGSRASGTMLRVYDKAAQQNQDGNHWIRVELEVKKPHADKLAAAMIGQGITAAGCAAIRDYIRTPLDWFEDLTEPGKYTIVEDGERKATDFENWIWTVVLPAVDKALQIPVEGLDRALTLLLKNSASRGLHGN